MLCAGQYSSSRASSGAVGERSVSCRENVRSERTHPKSDTRGIVGKGCVSVALRGGCRDSHTCRGGKVLIRTCAVRMPPSTDQLRRPEQVQLNERRRTHLSLVISLYIPLIVYADILERVCRPADCSAVDVFVSSPLHAVADHGDCTRGSSAGSRDIVAEGDVL